MSTSKAKEYCDLVAESGNTDGSKIAFLGSLSKVDIGNGCLCHSVAEQYAELPSRQERRLKCKSPPSETHPLSDKALIPLNSARTVGDCPH